VLTLRACWFAFGMSCSGDTVLQTSDLHAVISRLCRARWWSAPPHQPEALVFNAYGKLTCVHVQHILPPLRSTQGVHRMREWSVTGQSNWCGFCGPQSCIAVPQRKGCA